MEFRCVCVCVWWNFHCRHTVQLYYIFFSSFESGQIVQCQCVRPPVNRVAKQLHLEKIIFYWIATLNWEELKKYNCTCLASMRFHVNWNNSFNFIFSTFQYQMNYVRPSTYTWIISTWTKKVFFFNQFWTTRQKVAIYTNRGTS